MQKKPFDFANIKIIIKRLNDEDHIILLNKNWTRENIPHFK